MAQQTTKLEEDESLHGISWSPPILNALVGAAFVGMGVFCNIQQISTSTNAFFASMQSLAATGHFNCTSHDIQVCVGLAQHWTQNQLTQLNPKLYAMALTLAMTIQCFMVSQGIPISRVYHQMKVRDTGTQMARTFSAARETAAHLSLWQWLALIAFTADVIGDVRFALITTNDVLTVVFWALFLSAGSTLLLLNGVQRLWGAFHQWSVYRSAKSA
jgi:hypothetical protein